MRTVTDELNDIINDPLTDEEEDGLTGKPYAEDETPITVEEARETLLEMRRVLLAETPGLGDDYSARMALSLANDTGLEIEPVGSPQFCEHQQYRSLCPACSPLA